MTLAMPLPTGSCFGLAALQRRLAPVRGAGRQPLPGQARHGLPAGQAVPQTRVDAARLPDAEHGPGGRCHHIRKPHGRAKLPVTRSHVHELDAVTRTQISLVNFLRINSNFRTRMLTSFILLEQTPSACGRV